MCVRWYSSSSAGVSRWPRRGALRGARLGARAREEPQAWLFGGEGGRTRARTHLSSSAGDGRSAGRARHRPRSTNAAAMGKRRAGPARAPRNSAPRGHSAPCGRRAPLSSAGPARGTRKPPGFRSQEAAPASTPASAAPRAPRAALGAPHPWGRARPRAPPGSQPRPGARLSHRQGPRALRGAPGRAAHLAGAWRRPPGP